VPLSSDDYETVHPASMMPTGRPMPYPAPSSGSAFAPPPVSPYAAVPIAPGSLAPMAMSRDAVGTGPQQINTVIVRTRANLAAGITLLVGGILVGGIFGVLTRTRPDASSASEAPAEASSPPPVISPSTTSPPSSAVAVPGPVKDVKDAKDAKDGAKKGPKHAHASAPAHVAPPVHTPAPAKTPSSKKEKDDGWTVASPVGTNEPKEAAPAPPPAPKADKHEKAPPPEKAAEAPKKEAAPKPAPDSNDAVNVLKAARGATENTL
jgi:hypothetical protein